MLLQYKNQEIYKKIIDRQSEGNAEHEGRTSISRRYVSPSRNRVSPAMHYNMKEKENISLQYERIKIYI